MRLRWQQDVVALAAGCGCAGSGGGGGDGGSISTMNADVPAMTIMRRLLIHMLLIHMLLIHRLLIRTLSVNRRVGGVTLLEVGDELPHTISATNIHRLLTQCYIGQ